MSDPKMLYKADNKYRLPCTRCGADLYFLNPEEKSKTKGTQMLYCAEPTCCLKHHGEVDGLAQYARDLGTGKVELPIPTLYSGEVGTVGAS